MISCCWYILWNYPHLHWRYSHMSAVWILQIEHHKGVMFTLIGSVNPTKRASYRSSVYIDQQCESWIVPREHDREAYKLWQPEVQCTRRNKKELKEIWIVEQPEYPNGKIIVLWDAKVFVDMFTSTWVKKAQLSCWLLRGPQVLHQR